MLSLPYEMMTNSSDLFSNSLGRKHHLSQILQVVLSNKIFSLKYILITEAYEKGTICILLKYWKSILLYIKKNLKFIF